MNLKVNRSYNADCGILIPRSHLKGEKGERFAVFDVLTQNGNNYTKKTRTFSTKELRKLLHVGAKERIDIC